MHLIWNDITDIIDIVLLILIIILYVMLYCIEDKNHEYMKNVLQENNNSDDEKYYRKIDLTSTKIYYLTVGTNYARKMNMQEQFGKDNLLVEINPKQGIPRNMSGASGFLNMIDSAIKDQNKDSIKFKPFILLEDDCSKYRDFPKDLYIPKDADIVYLGLSKYGIDDSGKNKVYADNYDDNFIKIKNMLATHGMMITSNVGMSIIQRCMTESYSKNTPWDIPLAYAQKKYNIYALKIPLVYQDMKVGGQEHATKLTHFNMPIDYDEKNINPQNITTC
jgi:hypothetical protein